MTKREYYILMKDICARIPYGVKCWTCYVGEKFCNIVTGYDLMKFINDGNYSLQPYLRRMQDMTKKEREIYCGFMELVYDKDNGYKGNGVYKTERRYMIPQKNQSEAMDFLNSHHFDYRNLIEKGLALEAPKDMYVIKNK